VSRFDAHPTVRAVRARRDQRRPGEGLPPAAPLDAGWLRELVLAAGADDVGFVEIDRPALADQRDDIEAAFPRPRALISFVCRTNVEAIRSPARSVGNKEFHHTYDFTNAVAHQVCRALEAVGVRAMNPAAGFPMEMDRWPGKMWVVTRFGTFVLLGTVILDAEITAYDQPVSFNPCLECKLCVAACPTGAISKTGEFNFSACATHNYREFLTGFSDWVDTVTESRDHDAYRRDVTDPETVSMWQSLAFGPQYKAAYCVSVCPAGEDVIGPWLDDRKRHLTEVVKPLQNKAETVYVVAGSDAEAHVRRRFAHKTVKRAALGIRPRSVDSFISGLPLLFQPGAAADLAAVYHFRFRGAAERDVTVAIADQGLQVSDGLHGAPDLLVTADATTWVEFLNGRGSLPWALLRRRLRLRGRRRLLRAFARCFPS
jgi:ferredoxin